MIARPVTVSERTRVFIATSDPVSRAGIATQLRGSQGIEMVDERGLDSEVVGLVVVDDMNDDTVQVIRSLKRRGLARVVLVVTHIDDGGLLAAVEAGTCSLLRRSEATAQNLSAAIRAAATGDGSLPPDLLGRLLDQVGRLQRQVLSPRGLSFAGITDRETKVLRLLAEGDDTAAVARKLFYSERTVKNIIHDVTSRLNLRNRTQAVVYAIKQGLI